VISKTQFDRRLVATVFERKAGAKMGQNGTVNYWFGQYLACAQLAESSVDIKKRACKYFIELFGDIDVEKTSYSYAEDFRNWLVNRSERSANSYIRNFRPFWVWLVKRRVIETNPFEDITYGAIEEFRGGLFTADEIECLMRIAYLQWQVMITLGLLGLRRSEVLNLTIPDLELSKERIYIRGKKATDQTWEWSIKNHQQAIIGLPETMQLPGMTVPVHKLIRELIDWNPTGQLYLCVKPERYAEMLKRQREGRLTFIERCTPWGNFTRDFRRLQERANINPIKRFQDLRATYATNMASQLSLVETQRLMRHSSSQITARYYIRLNEQELVSKSNEIASQMFAAVK
jgi:integrase